VVGELAAASLQVAGPGLSRLEGLFRLLGALRPELALGRGPFAERFRLLNRGLQLFVDLGDRRLVLGAELRLADSQRNAVDAEQDLRLLLAILEGSPER